MRFYCIFFSLILFSSLLGGPTSQFLGRFSESEILKTIASQPDVEIDMSKFMPIFKNIVANEGEGFFGYHATCAKHYFFHLIVKSTLQELYQLDVPAEFYFLRSPGDPLYEIKDKTAFFKKFAIPKISLKKKKQFLECVFCRPSQGAFSIKQFSEDEIDTLYRAFLYFFAKPVGSPIDFEEAKTSIQNVINCHAKDEKSVELVQTWLVDNPDEFQKRVLKLSENDEQLLFELSEPFCDAQGKVQKLLVSLNIALFAHYSLPSESSIHIFAKNQSIDIDSDELLEKELSKFFNRIGYEQSIVTSLVSYMKQHQQKLSGVLLQFFDNTLSQPDPMLDQFAYIAENFGSPDARYTPSHYLLNFDPSNFQTFTHEEQTFILHPQLRLVMCKEILKPNSWLKIRIYHQNDTSYEPAISQFVKECLAKHAVDREKVKAFGNYLKNAWFH